MATTNTTSNRIDYDYVRNTAYDFLQQYSDGKLPINLQIIIDKLDNLHLTKYSYFAEKMSISVREVCDLLHSRDGALMYNATEDCYILFYNDTVRSRERIRFTIAHELGHYALRHNELSSKTVISRNTLTNSEYEAFEQEANHFAKHLLVPFPVLQAYWQFFGEVSTSFIQLKFLVSSLTANYVINNLNALGKLRYRHTVTETFEKYITTDQTSRICRNCNSKISTHSAFCHICATKQKEVKPTLVGFQKNKYKELKSRMRYKKFNVDENGYSSPCPKCQNEELIDDFCQVCGTYIQNVCTGASNRVDLSFSDPTDMPMMRTKGCGQPLDGNSRYCSICGSFSTFYIQGLFTDWQEELEADEELPW